MVYALLASSCLPSFSSPTSTCRAHSLGGIDMLYTLLVILLIVIILAILLSALRGL